MTRMEPATICPHFYPGDPPTYCARNCDPQQYPEGTLHLVVYITADTRIFSNDPTGYGQTLWTVTIPPWPGIGPASHLWLLNDPSVMPPPLPIPNPTAPLENRIHELEWGTEGGGLSNLDGLSWFGEGWWPYYTDHPEYYWPSDAIQSLIKIPAAAMVLEGVNIDDSKVMHTIDWANTIFNTLPSRGLKFGLNFGFVLHTQNIIRHVDDQGNHNDKLDLSSIF